MSEKIGIGVIGIGFGQYVHVPAFRADSRCEVRAICATSLDRASAASQALQIPRAYADPRAMIEDPTVDAVSIAVPPYLQPSLIEASARAGKHIFCEKPLGLSLDECGAAVNAARQANVRHAVNFIFPEIFAWQEAKRILGSGQLGPVRHAVVSWRVETRAYQTTLDNWKTSRLQGGGTLLNLVSHSAYYVEWLFGKIASLAAHLRGAPVDAGVDAWMRTAGNLDVAMSVSGDSYMGTGHRVEVYCERGSLILRNASADYVNGFELLVALRDRPPTTAVSPKPSATDGRITATSSIVRRFIDSIVDNSAVEPNLDDGLRVQNLLDAMRKASESRQWVDV